MVLQQERRGTLSGVIACRKREYQWLYQCDLHQKDKQGLESTAAYRQAKATGYRKKAWNVIRRVHKGLGGKNPEQAWYAASYPWPPEESEREWSRHIIVKLETLLEFSVSVEESVKEAEPPKRERVANNHSPAPRNDGHAYMEFHRSRNPEVRSPRTSFPEIIRTRDSMTPSYPSILNEAPMRFRSNMPTNNEQVGHRHRRTASNNDSTGHITIPPRSRNPSPRTRTSPSTNQATHEWVNNPSRKRRDRIDGRSSLPSVVFHRVPEDNTMSDADSDTSTKPAISGR